MQTYSPGKKGRRKVVDQFSIWEGLWIIAFITVFLGGLMVMWMLGHLQFDTH